MIHAVLPLFIYDSEKPIPSPANQIDTFRPMSTECLVNVLPPLHPIKYQVEDSSFPSHPFHPSTFTTRYTTNSTALFYLEA